MSGSLLNDDIQYLAEIYELNDLNFQIVKETIKYTHAYKVIGNEQILIEGFMDVVNKMGEFFKKMIEKIKEFFKKILMYVNACFMDIDKFVKKYKSDLDKLKKINFDINGYEFTMHEAPDMTEFNDIVSNYNAEISDAKTLKKEDILKRQNEYLSSQNLDKLRGEILGTNSNITEDDFNEEVRKYYRNGELDSKSIHIDDSEFRKVVSNVDTIAKGKREAEKTRDELIVLLDKTQRFFDQKVSTVYVKKDKNIKVNRLNIDNDRNVSKGDDEYVSYTDTTASAVEYFIRFKYNQVNKIATMINICASERANAYKDQVKQCRDIIKRALFNSKDEDTSSAS